MPHTVSDVLVVLREDRERSLDELEDAMRERVREGARRLDPVHDAARHAHRRRTRRHAGGPLRAHLRPGSRGAGPARGRRARPDGASVPGIADLRAEPLTGLPQLRIGVDRGAAARVGLTPGDVIDAVRIGLVGRRAVARSGSASAASTWWCGSRSTGAATSAAIRSLLVDGHDGTRIPLGQLAAIEETFAPAAIRREAGSRRIAVEASVAGRDLGGTAADVRSDSRRELELPPGYFFDVGGRVESQERAARSLARRARRRGPRGLRAALPRARLAARGARPSW